MRFEFVPDVLFFFLPEPNIEFTKIVTISTSLKFLREQPKLFPDWKKARENVFFFSPTCSRLCVISRKTSNHIFITAKEIVLAIYMV